MNEILRIASDESGISEELFSFFGALLNREILGDSRNDGGQQPFGIISKFAVETGFDAGRVAVAEIGFGQRSQGVSKFLITGIQTVGQSFVDHAVGDTLFEVGDGLFSGAFGGIERQFHPPPKGSQERLRLFDRRKLPKRDKGIDPDRICGN